MCQLNKSEHVASPGLLELIPIPEGSWELLTMDFIVGLPKGIITERDPIFKSNLWREVLDKLGIKLKFTTAYHPQTDGQSERVNQCIETYLRCMVFQAAY